MLWHLFDVMTKLLTSWRYDFMTNFSNHDICLTSWQTFYIMTYLWLHDKLLTLWQSFWRHGVFLMSWRTWWRHNELCDVITFSFNNKLDIMTSFVTSCRTFLFEIMMKLLTSWCVYDIMTNFWCDKLFDVMPYVALIDVMTNFLTNWHTFWPHD